MNKVYIGQEELVLKFEGINSACTQLCIATESDVAIMVPKGKGGMYVQVGKVVYDGKEAIASYTGSFLKKIGMIKEADPDNKTVIMFEHEPLPSLQSMFDKSIELFKEENEAAFTISYCNKDKHLIKLAETYISYVVDPEKGLVEVSRIWVNRPALDALGIIYNN